MNDDGILVVDKPSGWTSHDVVARTRRLAGTRRVGHAGTLDPMATGVLVLGVNRGTKLLTYLVGADKEYTATIRLGVGTVTDDAEGDVTTRRSTTGLARDAVEAGIARLTGPIRQVPSSVSAIKIDGRRSYARVRAGEEVELPARPVTVQAFDLLAFRPVVEEEVPALDLDVRVVCSSGTYVRALARDLGAGLDVGGHLTALRRARVGPFGLDRAVTLDALAAVAGGVPSARGVTEPAPSARGVTEPAPSARGVTEPAPSALGVTEPVPSALGVTEPVPSALGVTEPAPSSGSRRLPLVPLAAAAAATLPVRRITAAEAARLGHGGRIAAGGTEPAGDPVAAIDPAGILVSIITDRGAAAVPLLVLAPA